MSQPLHVGKNLLTPQQLARAATLYERTLLPIAVAEEPNAVLFASMLLLLVAAHNTGADHAEQLTGALRAMDRLLRQHRGDAGRVMDALNGKDGDALERLKEQRVIIPGVTQGAES